MAEGSREDAEVDVPVVEGLEENEGRGQPVHGIPPSLSLAFTKTADFFKKEAKEIVEDIKALTVDDKIVIPAMIFFGDSLTEYGLEQPDGWITRLRAEYGHKADLIGRGVHGYNSRWTKFLIPKLVNATNSKCVRLATVLLGTNDAVPDGSAQHIGLAEYKANLYGIGRFLIEHLGGSSARDRLLLIFLTPPPVDETVIEKEDQTATKRSNERTKLYATACCEVAAALRVPVINLFEAMQADGVKYQAMLADGVHFNAKGNAFVAERVTELLRTNYPRLLADSLSEPAASWRDIDPKSLAPSVVLPKPSQPN